jgi:orotate phosphoribosyltransferase
MTPSQNPVEELLVKSGAIKEGHFLLSSGLRSNRYCQCATLFENPAYGGQMAEMMASKLRAEGVQPTVVLAPALGAILWGYEVARALGVRSLFAERPDGKTFALRRGFELHPSDRVLLAEDVITTGGSILELVPLVKAAGAELIGYCCIADRSRGAFKPAEPFHSLIKLEFQTWTAEEDPLAKAGSIAVKPGSRG